MTEIKELVTYVARALADRPDDVTVSEIEGETSVVLEMQVAPEDMGRMIGRQGRTINALRSVAQVLGGKNGKKVNIELL